jgi:hypothetical protein
LWWTAISYLFCNCIEQLISGIFLKIYFCVSIIASNHGLFAPLLLLQSIFSQVVRGTKSKEFLRSVGKIFYAQCFTVPCFLWVPPMLMSSFFIPNQRENWSVSFILQFVANTSLLCRNWKLGADCWHFFDSQQPLTDGWVVG